MSAEHRYQPQWLHEPKDINALETNLWPNNTYRDGVGDLVVGGMPVSDMTAEVGTVSYIYDKDTVVSQARLIKQAFDQALATKHVSLRCYYASKAFSASGFIRWISDEGFAVDVASLGELEVAMRAGVDPALIGVHGNNKTDELLHSAIAAGVGSIVLDYAKEITRVARIAESLGKRQPVRLRVTTGVHAETHDFLATAVEDQKFGVPLAEVPQLVAAIRHEPALDFLGMHSHIGSQIFNAEGFAKAIDLLIAMHAKLLEGGPVPQLNLGGGFGVAYTSADRPLPVTSIVHEIVAALTSAVAKHHTKMPDLAIEPGRFIAARAGVTLYTVGAIKDVHLSDEAGNPAIRKYVSVDGGMSDNPRPELYDAQYSAVLSRSSTAKPVLCRVVGMHCESGDIVVHDVFLPADVSAGDTLVVPVTGAYNNSLSSNYNMTPRPGAWGITGDRLQPLIRRETIADLLSRDVQAEGDRA